MVELNYIKDAKLSYKYCRIYGYKGYSEVDVHYAKITKGLFTGIIGKIKYALN